MPSLCARLLICVPDNSTQRRPGVPPGVVANEITERIVAAASAHCSNAAVGVRASTRDVLTLAVASHTSHIGGVRVHPQAAICVVGVLGACEGWRVSRLECQAHVRVEHHLT